MRSPLLSRLAWLLILLLAAALLYWALTRVPLANILEVLSSLRIWQLALFLFVNSGIILLMTLRWWLLMRAQGHTLPYIAATRYRLAAFGVSYFTPGPHFGGEPLQVYFVRQRHGVPGSTALAAITMDKVLELLVNFSFLAFGIAMVSGSGLLDGDWLRGLQPLSILLLVLPLLYLLLLALGLRPLKQLAARLPQKWSGPLSATEEQLAHLARRQPKAMLQAMAASLLVWAALLFEYWLLLIFLGLKLNLFQLITIVTASRLAMLAPTPGALGALEAAQLLAMQTLGFAPAYALSLSLLIRARDIFFGLIGLWWGGLGRR
jgi:uncharacterized protein (TIRG00374 family)